MTEIGLVLLAIGSILAAGDIVIRLLAPRMPLLLPERLGLAWVLGAGVLPVAVWMVGPFVGPQWVRVLVPCAVFASAIVVWKRRAQEKLRAPFRVFDGVLALVLMAQLVFVAMWASRLMLGWDALLIWGAKSRMIFAGSGAMPGEYFTDATMAWTHPHYPFGFAALGAWFHLCLGHVDEGWIRVLGPLYWLSAVGIVVGATVRLGGSRTAGLVAAVVMFFVPHLFARSLGVLSGYADFPLGVIVLAAASWLLRCEDITAARLCGILMAVATWTKLEGRYLWLMIAGLAVLILGIASLREKRWKPAVVKLLWIVLPGAIVLLAWAAFVQHVGMATNAHHHPVTPSSLVDNASRIPSVAWQVVTEQTDWESWSFLWPGVILAILSFLLRKEWRNAGVFGALLLAVQGIFVVVYTLSTWPDYQLHMDLSLSRLFLQLAPTAVLSIALAIPNPSRTRVHP